MVLTTPALMKEVVRSKISRGYVDVDSLGEILLLPEQYRRKMTSVSNNFSC